MKVSTFFSKRMRTFFCGARERSERGVDAVELGELAKVYGKSLNYFIK